MKEKVKELIAEMQKEIEENKKIIISEDNAKVREVLSALNDGVMKINRSLNEFLMMYELGHLIADSIKTNKD